MNAKRETLKKLMTYLLVIGFFGPGLAIANDIDAVFESEPLEIEGSWQNRNSEAQKMAKFRKELERKTNDMMAKKIENERIKKEKQINKEIMAAFNGKFRAMDEVGTQSSGVKKEVVKEVVIGAPIATVVEEKKLKIIPSVGFYNLKSDNIDFDSKIKTGVSLESMVNKRVSFGVGFNFSSMKLYDPNNSYNGFSNNFYNPYAGFNNPCFNSGFGNGCVNYNEREIDYKSMGLELNSKVFLSTSSRVKPFIGAGVSYNRVSLKYNDDGNGIHYYYNNSNNALGGEAYTSNTIKGSLILGTEVKFGDTVGLNLDFRIAKGFSSGNSSKREANTLFYNPDLDRLENIGNDMEETILTGVNLGLIVAF